MKVSAQLARESSSQQDFFELKHFWFIGAIQLQRSSERHSQSRVTSTCIANVAEGHGGQLGVKNF
jgi:hypothetical protein